MVKYRNIITRLGNKENDIKYFHHLLPRDPLVVVEPFGGSFAVIKHFYKDPEEYKFHINDTDERLNYVYLHPEELNENINKLNKLYVDEYEGIDYSKDDSFFTYVNGLDMNTLLKAYIIQHKICSWKVV
jgi:site-specific DNA-adenine methylase